MPGEESRAGRRFPAFCYIRLPQHASGRSPAGGGGAVGEGAGPQMSGPSLKLATCLVEAWRPFGQERGLGYIIPTLEGHSSFILRSP